MKKDKNAKIKKVAGFNYFTMGLIKIFLYNSRHLGRNPFVCDCSLQWLSDYLEIRPIETSGARCEYPRRLQRRKITALRDERLKCKFLFDIYYILLKIHLRLFSLTSFFLYLCFCYSIYQFKSSMHIYLV